VPELRIEQKSKDGAWYSACYSTGVSVNKLKTQRLNFQSLKLNPINRK